MTTTSDKLANALYQAGPVSPCDPSDFFASLLEQPLQPASFFAHSCSSQLATSQADFHLQDFDWPTPISLWDSLAMTFTKQEPDSSLGLATSHSRHPSDEVAKVIGPEPYCRGMFTPQQQDIFVSSSVQEMVRPSRRCDNIPNSSNTAFDPQQYDIDIKLGVPGKPYSYARLITYAIAHSQTGKMSLSDIYDFCIEHFPYFSEQDNSGWKNSIRHNLSLNKLFVKIPRPVHESGKGAYWALDLQLLSQTGGPPSTNSSRHTSSSMGYSVSTIRAAGGSGRNRSQSALEPLQRAAMAESAGVVAMARGGAIDRGLNLSDPTHNRSQSDDFDSLDNAELDRLARAIRMQPPSVDMPRSPGLQPTSPLAHSRYDHIKDTLPLTVGIFDSSTSSSALPSPAFSSATTHASETLSYSAARDLAAEFGFHCVPYGTSAALAASASTSASASAAAAIYMHPGAVAHDDTLSYGPSLTVAPPTDEGLLEHEHAYEQGVGRGGEHHPDEGQLGWSPTHEYMMQHQHQQHQRTPSGQRRVFSSQVMTPDVAAALKEWGMYNHV